MDKTLTLRKAIYMRVSGASELRKFCIFTFKKCYFFQYFVGTSETLSVQMTYLSAYMYRQISKCTGKTSRKKKHYWGGNCPPPPAPSPSGYASGMSLSSTVGSAEPNVSKLSRYGSRGFLELSLHGDSFSKRTPCWRWFGWSAFRYIRLQTDVNIPTGLGRLVDTCILMRWWNKFQLWD